jgi:ketosteroid isomerase-like protein
MLRLPRRFIAFKLLAVFAFSILTVYAASTTTGRNTEITSDKSAVTKLASRDADRQAIESVLSSQQAAWNRGDIDAFLTGYWHSSELTFSGSSGISRGYDGVLARYRKSYPDRAAMGHLDFSQLEFHFLSSDAVLVLGHWQLRREKDAPGGVFSLVLQRFPEGWRIIHDHTSAVPGSPTQK